MYCWTALFETGSQFCSYRKLCPTLRYCLITWLWAFYVNFSCVWQHTGSSLLTTLGVFINSLKMCCLRYRHLSGDVPNWLDRAKENNGGRYSETSVENVKILVQLFPLFGLQVLYRACITQVSRQGKQKLCCTLTSSAQCKLIPRKYSNHLNILFSLDFRWKYLVTHFWNCSNNVNDEISLALSVLDIFRRFLPFELHSIYSAAELSLLC